MANEINITVGANETASDVISGVGKATQRTERVIVQSMGSTEEAFDTAVRGASKFGSVMDTTQGAAGQLSEGIDGVGQASQAISDIMSHSARKAEDLARAQTDVEQAAQDASQAVEDMNQAMRDQAQSAIDAEQADQDAEQAILDKAKAQKDLNAAIKEFGPNSDEARQARLDMAQAEIDHTQAVEDGLQAERDAQQAALDSKQALIDQKSAATELTASQRELASQSSILTQMSDWAGMLSGVLSGLVGIIGAVTAVQWLWNVAMTANPIGLIIVAIGALIAIIVLIATKTDWFQRLWKAIWSKIGDPVKATWNWIKNTTSSFIKWITNVFKNLPKSIAGAFKSLAKIITAPYRAAFNGIAWAWNNTIGRISFSVPSWVPGIGGASFSVPRIPSLDVGTDEVLKTGLAMIHKGERITPAKASAFTGRDSGRMGGHAEPLEIVVRLEMDATDSKIMEPIHENIRAYVKRAGGNKVQVAYGRGPA